MDAREKQILPPKSWETFEDLCHRLFMAIWQDPFTQKVGRRGQTQHGVDIFGSPGGDNYETYQGVQCKVHQSSTDYKSSHYLEQLEQEIEKANSFEPALQHWIFATTAPVDATLQQEARKISETRKQEELFTVSVLGWGEIVNLLCQHKKVLSEFYPESTSDIPELLKSVQAHVSETGGLLDTVKEAFGSPSDSTNRPIWLPVTFGKSRGLGPALMGRPLGPKDVLACPKLPEANLAIDELKKAYSVRIVGEPGAGKSVCAYQAAHNFSNEGWNIYRLADPRVNTLELEHPDAPERAVFIVDDAHLMESATLRHAEDSAGPQQLLLSTHNSAKHDASHPGSIVIDTKRAIRSIATKLLDEPEHTLAVVRRVDPQVGPLRFDITLEDRIAQAEKSATIPWQFCFIVGGGWNRAANEATAAYTARADITLAGIAIHQIASRDARSSLPEIIALLSVAGLTTEEIKSSVQWLINRRLILGTHNLRCPHQRFAVAVLKKILEKQEHSGHQQISLLLQHVTTDPSYPLAGLRLLLEELRFFGNWTFLISETSLEPLIERCWQASTSTERAFASLILSEIGGYVEGWPHKHLQHRVDILGHWISNPAEPSGYGLARLLHAIWNKDQAFANSIVEASEPRTVAAAISSATPETSYNLGEILGALHVDPDARWGRIFLENLDQPKLARLANNWPESKPAWAFSNLCRTISYIDKTLALDMVECFIPHAQKRLAENPISAFSDMMHIVMDVLHLLDILGVYVGKLAPKSRHRLLARKMLQKVSLEHLPHQLSAGSLHDFQNITYLLIFMAEVTPSKFESVIAKMDWTRIADTIGDQWKNLPHEAGILFEIAFHAGAHREQIAQVIYDNLHRIEAFPPRLVRISPNAAYEHAKQGGLIRLVQHDRVDWDFGTIAIAYFAEERPNLLEKVVKPFEIKIGQGLSHTHPSWYEGAANCIYLLKEKLPISFQRILDAVDVQGATKGWPNALRNKKSSQKTVALLIEACLERSDELGVLAKHLRKRFPKSSRPDTAKFG